MVKLLDAMYTGLRRLWHCLRAWRQVSQWFKARLQPANSRQRQVSLVRLCNISSARSTRAFHTFSS